MCEDPYARYNLQEAQRVGIKVGAYFFSTAVNEAEVVEEATFTAKFNLISTRLRFRLLMTVKALRAQPADSIY